MDNDPPMLGIAEAAVARLCHDLSGSLGAVVNGLDLAGSRGNMADEAIQFAAEAAREAAARLKLARALWDSQNRLDLTRLPLLADGLPNRSRLQLNLEGLRGGEVSPEIGRLLLAVLIAAAEALRGAGLISIAGDADHEVVVMIDGPRAAWSAELPQILASPAPNGTAPDPRQLAVRLVGLFARAAGAQASLLLSSGAPEGPPPLLIRLTQRNVKSGVLC